MNDGQARRLAELRAGYPQWEITTELAWGAAAWRHQALDIEGVERGLVNVLLAWDVEALDVRLARQAAAEAGAAPAQGSHEVSFGV
ncbi:hypothetical protein [Nonomuraea ceibae]|uniref:hypothetical protein n=1 Tax=Nonomuraea ceibae TaxID=1935170 RepID=UPI001C5CFBBA|nr:hypothetical protein [Nonomuraea ceibae]